MKKSVILGLSLLISLSLSAQTSANLSLNPEKNKVYRFNSSTEQTILQTINGNQQTIESKTANAVSFKAVDATASFVIAQVTFDTLSTKTNTMGKTINMSSAAGGNIQSKETSVIMSAVMNKLSRNPMFAKIDFTGKVVEIINSKMISDMIMKDTSSITLTGPTAPALKTQISGMVADNAMRTMIEQYTHFVPGKQVTKGESWTISESINSGGMALEITTTCHLTGIDGNIASVTSESNIKAAPNAAPMKSAGATITYDDLKGMGKSTITLDIRTGLPVAVDTKSQITGNLGVSGPGFSMQIPMEISSTTRVNARQ